MSDLPPLRDTMIAPTEPVVAAETVIRLGPITVTIAEIRVHRYRAAQAARLRCLEADPWGADIGYLDRRVDDLRHRCRRQANPRPYSADVPPAASRRTAVNLS